jgi:hypothetical protein
MSKQTKKEDFPALECPHCEKPVAPYSLNVDGSVTYSCRAAADHPDSSVCTWRIARDGTFLDRNRNGTYSAC